MTTSNQSPVGHWKAISAVMAGTPFPEPVIASISLTVSDDGYEANVGGQVDQGTCETDTTKKPYQMRIVGVAGPNAGKTFLAIFDFPEKDQMQVAYDLTGTAHPNTFESSAENGNYVAVYSRQK